MPIDAVASPLPLIAVVAPVAVAIAVAFTGRWPNVRETITVVGAIATFGVVAWMLPGALDGTVSETTFGQLVPGVTLGLRADGMGMVLALSAAFLWILASVYAIGYLRGANAANQTRFYSCFALCLAAAFGLAFAADLLTFYLFYELLTVATYPLVVHSQTPKALAAGRKYLAYLLSGGVAVLLAMAIIYQSTGDLAFVAGGFLEGQMSTPAIVAVFALMTFGFGTKAGLMPLHAWLPSAMVAPTPVSALLHAVAVVKAGVFGFARMIGFVVGPATLAAVDATTVLAVLAVVTIVVASVIALRQDNLKRRLAFSTIAHLSYIIFGLSIMSATAWDGALLHIVNHALLKITLFFCAGALLVHVHLDRVSQLDGIGRRMPVTMGAFGLASVGLVGLPPMGGFMSKWYLSQGAFDGDQAVLGLILVASGMLTAGYLFPITYRAFFRAPSGDLPVSGEATGFMVVPLAMTAIVGLLLGFGDLFGVHQLASGVAAAVMGGTP